MLSQHRAARMIPIAALLVAALVACSDNSTPTAPLTLHPSLTQLTASPVVNSLNDPGTGGCDDTECTLREAIAFASSGATITFSVTGTITVVGSPLSISTNTTINGPGATQLAVSGNGLTQVFTNSYTTTISGLTITGGYITAGTGAGITNYGNLTLVDCAVTGNTAYFNQGGGIGNYGTLVVKSSTISKNTAHYYAGGIYNSTSASALVINSTISGNLASGGGQANGIYNRSGTFRIVNSTITNNYMGVLTYDNATTVIKGSIISGNTYDIGTGYTSAIYTTLGHNLVGNTEPPGSLGLFNGPGDVTGVTNPHLDTLALNTPGQTRTHALLTGSEAIDAGSCTDHLDATIATDQRGVSRPQGSACDIGAYELQASGGTTPTFTFNLSTLPPKTFGDTAFSVTSYVGTNSTGAVTFATGSGSVGCSVSGIGQVTITGAAINPNACIVEASLAADATYTSAGPISQNFNIAKATGSVSISNIPSSAAVGGSFTPTYTKSGDGTASTVSNSTDVCTVTSGVVDYIAEGSCLLQASVTEGSNHLAATGSEQSFTVSLATPTFTFDLSTLPAKTYGDSSFSVADYVTTNSTGAVTFGTVLGSVGCSVTSAGIVTITGAAVDPNHCVIEATLAPTATYAGAGPTSQTLHIAKAAGSVTINNMPASGSVGGSFAPTYTMSGDGTASTVSNSTGVCTVTSGVVNYIAAGTCLLQASVTAGTNHLAATGSEQNFTVSAGTPTFEFNLSTLPTKAYGDGSFSVASYATTNSTGAVTFALGTSSVGCSVTSAGLVTITGAAVDPSHCVIAATLAASESYSGAGPIEQGVNIDKAAGSVSINNMPVSATVGGQFTPTLTKSGDGAASVASLTTTVCTVVDGGVNFIAAGDCILQASVTEGTNHLAVTGSQQTVTVSPLSVVFASTCTYTINAKNNQRQVTISWENADPGVTQIQVTDGRIVTKQLAPTTTGSWSTNVKTGVPTYGLWGGTSRRDVSTTHVASGTACVSQ